MTDTTLATRGTTTTATTRLARILAALRAHPKGATPPPN